MDEQLSDKMRKAGGSWVVRELVEAAGAAMCALSDDGFYVFTIGGEPLVVMTRKSLSNFIEDIRKAANEKTGDEKKSPKRKAKKSKK